MEIKEIKEDFYKRIKQEAFLKNIPLQSEIDLTYQCNAKCFFCFQGDEHKNKRKLLDYDEICDILIQLKSMGCLFIGFSGGEPFLRQDFIEILKFAKKLGFVISIITNLQMANKQQIEELCKIGVNRITVSFHSIDPERYCSIFKVDLKKYDSALRNIKTLIENNVSVGVAVTVSNVNYFEMHKIREFFLNLGMRERDINFNMLIQGKNDIQNCRQDDNFEKYISNHRELKNEIIEKSDSILCSAGRTSLTINPYGDVLPCTFFNAIAGNIREEKIFDIWNNSHVFKFIRSIKSEDFDKCNGCKNKNYCHICMANNMNESSDFRVPSFRYCDFRMKITDNLLGEDYEN